MFTPADGLRTVLGYAKAVVVVAEQRWARIRGAAGIDSGTSDRVRSRARRDDARAHNHNLSLPLISSSPSPCLVNERNDAGDKATTKVPRGLAGGDVRSHQSLQVRSLLSQGQ